MNTETPNASPPIPQPNYPPPHFSIFVLIIVGLVLGLAAYLLASVALVSAKPPDLVIEGDIVSGSNILIHENSWQTYTVRLSAEPSSDVTITLYPYNDNNKKVHVQWSNNGSQTATFTADNWNTPQTVRVWGWGDYNTVTDREVITHGAWDDGDTPNVTRLYAYIQDQDGPSVTLPVPTATPTATPAPKAGLIITTPDEHAYERKDSNGDVIKAMKVAKGGSATFSVKLATKPTANVPVNITEYGDRLGTLSQNPTSLTFTPNNWNTAQTITVTSANTPEGTSGNEANLMVRTGNTDDLSGYYNLPWVWQRVYEFDPPAIWLASRTATVTEGADYAYSVRLNTQPTADVTIAISEGAGDADITVSPKTLTFTPDKWDYAQSVTLSAAHDFDLVNGSRVINHTTSSADSAYDGLAIALTATESDDDSASIIVSKTAVTVPEGGSANYTIKLSNKPAAAVTILLNAAATTEGGDEDIGVSPLSLSFSTSNWNVARTVTVSALEDTDDLNGTSTITHRASGAEFEGVTLMVAVTEADNDERGFMVAPAPGPLAMDEGGSHSYTVRLGTPPTANVIVDISASGDSDITVAPAQLSFDANNYATPQTVTISAAEDDTDYADDTATITHTVTTADTIYAEFSIGDIAVTAKDNDAALILSTTALTVPEGGNATYSIKLTHSPTSPVTVTLSEGAGDSDITISPISQILGGLSSDNKLTFDSTDWDTPKLVAISAAHDADFTAGSRVINHSASGGGYDGRTATLTATEREHEIILSAASMGVPEGGSNTYTVTLNNRPSGTVRVRLSAQTGGDSDITFSPSNLYFYNNNSWPQTRTVTVRARDDADGLAGNKIIAHTASGGGYNGVTANLTATETENDQEIQLSTTSLAVTEGGTATYSVSLNILPTSDVTVTITEGSGDTDITVTSSKTLTFTSQNYSTAQTVTLAAAEDDTDIVPGTRTISHSASGGGYNNITATLTATESDNDTGQITLTPTQSVNVTEGGTANYTVKLGLQPTGDVTVTISEGTAAPNNDTDITVTSPSNKRLTFTKDNWNVNQTVTLSAAEDADSENGVRTINHSASGGGYDGVTKSVQAWEADNDHAIVLSTTTLTVTEGGSATYSVGLNVRPTGIASVTVALTSTGDADLTFAPASLTFTTQNYFTSQTVTVSAAEDNTDVAAGTKTITHTASGGGYNNITATLTATESDNDTGALTLTKSGSDITALTVNEGGSATYDVKLSHKPGANVTVALSASGDTSISTNPTSLTFSTSTWNTNQTVTVSAAEDNDQANGTSTITHTANGGGYNSVTGTVNVTEAENDPQIILYHATNNTEISAITVPENGTASYRVALNRAPASNFVAALQENTGAPNNDGDITVTTPSNKQLTFTTNNWQTKQTVTLSAANDSDKIHGTRSIFHHTVGTYFPTALTTLIATEADDDIPVLSVSNITANWATLGLTKHTGNWYAQLAAGGGTPQCWGTAITTSTYDIEIDQNTTYTVQAYSDAGCATLLAENSVTFTTLNPSLATSNVTHNSATLTLSNWDISKDGNWYHKPTGTTGINCVTTAISTSTAQLTDLSASTAYTWKAYSASGCSESDLIATAPSFTTNAPPSPTLTVTNIGTSTATLTLANYTGNWSYKHTGQGTTGCVADVSNSTVNLTGLTPGTSYTYEAFSDGSLCETKIATAAAFTTNTEPNSLEQVSEPPRQETQQQDPPPATPPAAVQNLAGYWDTQDTIILTWDAADRATGYHVVYSTDEMQSWTRAATDHPDNTYTFHNATSSEKYIFGLAAANSAGHGPWTNSDTIKYPDYVPGSVSGLAGSRNAKGGIDLSWNPVASAIGYHIVYSTDGMQSWTRAETKHSGTTYLFANADPSATYIFGLTAVNARGHGPWTNSAPISPDGAGAD